MYVILDIFSGVPNPCWDLSQEQVSEFLKKISEFKQIEKFHKDSNTYDLGYRGFRVEEKQNFSQEPRRFEIYDGIVRTNKNTSSYVLQDNEHSIEKWLLQTAPKSIDKDLLKYVTQEIENKIKKS